MTKRTQQAAEYAREAAADSVAKNIVRALNEAPSRVAEYLACDHVWTPYGFPGDLYETQQCDKCNAKRLRRMNT